VKRIPERRVRELVNSFDDMLRELFAEYDDDETDAEPPDFDSSYSPTGRKGGTVPEASRQAPPEKIPLPTSLVVVDEAQKAKR